MKYHLLFLLLFASSFCRAQNLVPNPSFEETIPCIGIGTCPYDIQQTCLIKDWQYPLYSPDYFNKCAGTGFVSIPQNFIGNQEVSSATNGYIGLYTQAGASVNAREFLGVKLTTPLDVGQKYYASIKVSLADCSKCGANNIGILLTTDSLEYSNLTNLPNYAHVYSVSLINDTSNWTLISGTFTATASYKYVYLGNFFDDVHTNSVIVNPAPCFSSSACYSYYYIDDVCVSLDSTTCHLATEVTPITKNNLVETYPNPATQLISINISDSKIGYYSLIDFMGNVVAKGIITSTTTVDVSTMPNGIYFLEIKHSNQTLYKKQLIVH